MKVELVPKIKEFVAIQHELFSDKEVSISFAQEEPYFACDNDWNRRKKRVLKTTLTTNPM